MSQIHLTIENHNLQFWTHFALAITLLALQRPLVTILASDVFKLFTLNNMNLSLNMLAKEIF